MPCLQLKRRAEDSDSESARPCQVLKKWGGRRIVVDPEDDDLICGPIRPRGLVPTSRKRGRQGEDKEGDGGSPHKRVKAAVQEEKGQPSMASTHEKRVSPKADGKVSKPSVPQQKAPKKPSTSLFSYLTRKGEKPIQPRVTHIRKETVREGPAVTALPKSGTSTASRPAATKPDVTKTGTSKGSGRLLPKNGDSIRVPKRMTRPATALPPRATLSGSSEDAAERGSEPSSVSGPASAIPAKKRRAEEHTDSPATKKFATEKAADGLADVRLVADPVGAPKTKGAQPTAADDVLTLAEAFPSRSPEKRKAEEYAAAPAAKKPAGGSKSSSWLFTGKLGSTAKARKVAGLKNGNASAKAEHDQVGNKGAQQRSNEQGSSIVGKAIDGSQQKATMPVADELPSSSGRKPAGHENYGTACFANAMLQALHSVPEICDYFIAKFRNVQRRPRVAGDANGSSAADETQQRADHAKAAKEQIGRSVSLSLGRHFERMGAAIRNGTKVTARELLELFGKRHRGFDGHRAQQDPMEFWQKLLAEVEAEESASGKTDSSCGALMRRLFGVQQVKKLVCGACGSEHETKAEKTTSLELPICSGGQMTTIADCLNQAFATSKMHGYTCESCHREDTTSGQEYIRNCSEYLLINLKRAGGHERLGTKIPIPENVILDRLMAEDRAPTTATGKTLANLYPDFRYEVVAFAEHHGRTQDSGHYTAGRKLDDKWYKCDDLRVSIVDRADDLQSTLACVVILKRG
ncbi:MAG: hypothetical protein Q9177_001604 [Variospora cf. flavescens]